MIIKHSYGQYEVTFQSVNLPAGIVITDTNVMAAYKNCLSGHDSIVLEPGEHAKSLEIYGELCRTLAQKGVTRKATLIAFGGGVIGDLVGFTAATYLRGVTYLQIPTTLLSQVDSSVGGKTGIDLPEGKNLVGVFYPPSSVQIDYSLLQTLPPRQFKCGIAEILKTSLIQSPILATELANKVLKPNDSRLSAIVEKCVGIKARIVQEDEFETKGLRAQLNYGHTVGHALEQVTNYRTYTHGEAIAIGMAVESKIGERMGFSNPNLTEFVESLMDVHGLPTKAVELREIDRIISAMRKDKKSSNGELSMSLVESIGNCSLVPNIDEALVKEVLHEFAKT
jgi:3-dehydroquinate synthase